VPRNAESLVNEAGKKARVVMDDKLVQLQKIGFTIAGTWELLNDEPKVALQEAFHGTSNILYAFVADAKLMYVGKTVRTLAKRMAGYESGHRSQITNHRNHEEIRSCLKNGARVEIYVLPDNGLLHYGEFHINLAAGLEDSLIKTLNPPWNAGQKETENETLEPTIPVNNGDSDETITNRNI